MGLLIGMSGALRSAGTLAGGVVAGVVASRRGDRGRCCRADRARLTVPGGWYALRRPADHAAEVAPAPGGP
jgi:hypothetical protein